MEEIEKLLEELKFEIGTTDVLKDSNEKIVLGTGNFYGKVLFVGDDSNLYIDENLKVRPGSSGEFLIKLCDIVGLLPEDYYITTLTKSEKNYRELEERDKRDLKEYLMMQISLMNPEVIVALGQDVAELLLEREFKFLQEKGKILEWRGNIKLLATYDANFAKKSRDDGGKRSKVAVEFWGDLKTIKNAIEGI
ncbi:MAG: uracil-DNA glycosylase family protein [Cetobacterium somerae]|jgi:DNA polymerase|uniref:Uracil-DNA glycosylase, family 4 n=1 Tax=Cetobacterium somerae ATCC BAA-474 TaxID=1319815 RepID=U7V8C8_9FUSO|nr:MULTISPECIES: uracil-DNA glycosylase family protein [Cetobacterium]ERT67962.1 uracil-DNA glycosylase, family 4 [Cetobacterium somerae ATCC BAA-474]MBC2854092.1 uracil-DNA glycosylase [Cetobacterium sp. 2G large]